MKNNFFLEFYYKFEKMGLDGRDFDVMLKSLPYKEMKREDGSVYYVCDIVDMEKGLKNE